MPARFSDTFVVLSGPRVNAQIVTHAGSLLPVGASMSSGTRSVLCVMLGLVQPGAPDYPFEAVLALTGHPDQRPSCPGGRS